MQDFISVFLFFSDRKVIVYTTEDSKDTKMFYSLQMVQNNEHHFHGSA
uniref:Uncharacterized protein n=1 Tax=Arundo donax TaxID=35708 RepID=A0A0A9H0X1_ARUDO